MELDLITGNYNETNDDSHHMAIADSASRRP